MGALPSQFVSPLHGVRILFCISLVTCMAVTSVARKISAEEKVPAKMQRVVQDEWELIEISGAPAG